MILTFSLSWLGIGLWLLANPQRLERAFAWRPRAELAWVWRVAGALVLAASTAVLARETGAVPASLGLLLVAMASSSIAVLFAPLRPRLYAISVPLSAAVAAVSWAIG